MENYIHENPNILEKIKIINEKINNLIKLFPKFTLTLQYLDSSIILFHDYISLNLINNIILCKYKPNFNIEELFIKSSKKFISPDGITYNNFFEGLLEVIKTVDFNKTNNIKLYVILMKKVNIFTNKKKISLHQYNYLVKLYYLYSLNFKLVKVIIKKPTLDIDISYSSFGLAVQEYICPEILLENDQVEWNTDKTICTVLTLS